MNLSFPVGCVIVSRNRRRGIWSSKISTRACPFLSNLPILHSATETVFGAITMSSLHVNCFTGVQSFFCCELRQSLV
jgi:hypothetical protein